MPEQIDTQTTSTATDQQPDSTVTTGGQAPAATFTQADIDRIVKDRLDRERGKFADYETLKQAAAKLAQLEAERMSEEEKRTAKLKEAEDRAASLERERDEALKKASEQLVRSAFVAEAAKAGAEHPADAYMLADKAGVSVSEGGDVLGVAEAVKALVTAGRLPVRKTQPVAGNINGAASGSTGTNLPALTPEQEAVAKKLGVSPEKYAQRLAETQKTRRP